MLYAAGADHREWRRWAALAAFGLLLIGGVDELAEASQHARLAGEWALAAELPDPAPHDDEVSARIWSTFTSAMRARDAGEVTAALHELADRRADLFGSGWQRFVEWAYPVFDPLSGAAAATARHRGLVLVELLTEDDLLYLDHGLAPGEPEPRYPQEWPEPSIVAPR